MFNIVESLWRLLVLIGCAFIQAIATILEGIARLFGMGSEYLMTFSGKILQKLDEGKYEAKMRENTVE